MRKQYAERAVRRAAAGILAAMAVFLAAPAMAAAEAQMNRVSDTLVEITSGSGPQAWSLRYGINAAMGVQPEFAPQFLAVEGGRAYFGLGGWLRLIDTNKGQVIGRWHFPGFIGRLTPAGSRLQVEVLDMESIKRVFRRTLTFDPNAPVVPCWPSNWLQLLSLPRVEAELAYPAPRSGWVLTSQKSPPENIKKTMPLVEEAVRRDPLSPWFRIRLGKLLRDLGDSRADTVFQQAVRTPGTDFTELLPISAFFGQIGERSLAAAAYEAGYHDFLLHDYDPRLLSILINRLVLYSPFPPGGPEKLDPAYRRELIERVYRLSPGNEGAALAWAIYADDRRQKGYADDARLWEQRAREAERLVPLYQLFGVGRTLDKILFLIPAGLFGGLFYFLVLYFRYRPQRRLALAARKQPGARRAGFALFNIEYWSRRDRLVFLTIVLALWLGVGAAVGFSRGILRAAQSPFTFGSGKLAGPVAEWYIGQLPATPERDFLLATVYQQDGENEKAEALYRRLPAFAESWNNLGVLLKKAGREQEARRAFLEALRINPQLAEAAVNAGRAGSGLWAELHNKYVPGQPMLAPPSGDMLQRAMLGASPDKILLTGLAGPFATNPSDTTFAKLWSRSELWFTFVPLVLAIGILFLVPSRDVTQPPGRWQWVAEVLFPGTSPAWGLLGGVALVAWLYFGQQALMMYWKGTARLTTLMTVPNLPRAYGVPDADMSHVLRLINPGWVWVYLPPVLLFVTNVALMFRGRLFGRRGDAASVS